MKQEGRASPSARPSRCSRTCASTSTWLAFGVALVFSGVAAAQSTPVIARAASVSGQALLVGSGSAPFLLTPGYILNPGDRIDTRGGGRVVIDLSDGSMVVVSPESVVILKDFRTAGSLRELFEIAVGLVRVKINHFAGKPNPYRMNSPTASIAVRGTEFSIEVDAQGDTQVVVYEGAVEVTSLSDPSHRVLIEAGRGVLVRPGQDFHLLAGALGSPGNRDAGDRNEAADRDHPGAAPLAQNGVLAQAQNGAGNSAAPNPSSNHGPDNHGGGPGAPPGGPTGGPSQTSWPGQPQPQPQAAHDREEGSPRATASTYDRYVAGLADVQQLPFLFRFNAYPEAHLDSLENPAYATGFEQGEGRIFVLPTFSGVRGLQEYQSAFGPAGSLPGNYSISPQLSMFSPIGAGFTLGGSVSASRVGDTSLSSQPDFEAPLQGQPGVPGAPGPGVAIPGVQRTSANSTSDFYSGALVLARRLGPDSFGLELESLKGTGSLDSTTTDSTSTDTGTTGNNAGAPGSTERINSVSTVNQTRLTAGYSHDFSKNLKLGLFYRYAFIGADDHDVSHTVGGMAMKLDGTRTSGHSFEFGLRLRGAITPRLYYGVTAAWLGVSLQDSLARAGAVDSGERDRAQRGSMALGLGYALTRRAMLSFDVAGGASRAWAARTENATGNLLQNGVANGHFASMHAAIQVDITRRLFASASLLNIWQCHDMNVTLFPDRYGYRTMVEDSFFPANPMAWQTASRFSDFGAGWRFTRDLFAQYLFSTDYGATRPTHTLMVRYTFRLRRE
ncbi:MAG TPA: FecR family protein [Candidatus Acidoferrales bacterium]|nr:FecR family protein [Candidatus Acidoferrales bacterium]